MSKSTEDINLGQFCASRDSLISPISRFDIYEPFALGGFEYATDGVVCVRVPTAADDATGKLPPVGALPWEQEGDTVEVSCERKVQKCPWCDGSGTEFEWQKILPERPCEQCHGSGKISHPPYVLLGGQWFAGRYIRPLSELPNARLVCPPDIAADSITPRLIRFDGGEAMLMPCEAPKDNEERS